MTFDPSKMQTQNQLAKKLVEQRLAANMDDAMKQISGHDEIMEEVVELTPHGSTTVENKEVVKVENTSNDKITELENKIKRLNDFFNQFRDVVNKNFKELDEKVNAVKNTRVVAAASAPAQQNSGSSAAAAKKPQTSQKADPDNFTEDQYSVDKFFSNANNKMGSTRK